MPELHYVEFYEKLAKSIGNIRNCRAVNDKKSNYSLSRDIKPNPDLNHYFASNTRQPLHTDYAYYEKSKSPEWLLLYCLKNSKYGGKTNILSSKKLLTILKCYKPELINKLDIDINWLYRGPNGDKIHKKPILHDTFINWNYWQIKSKYNDSSTMHVVNEFFEFLEDIIVSGNIYDFSKKWSIGDCLIFNDRINLHGRDAFVGDRWLKDHAIYS